MAGRATRAGAGKGTRQADAESFRRPPTAQAAVLAELRVWISEGRLRPGEQVLSDVIAQELGVSRVPVREALRILEGEGQVTYTPTRATSSRSSRSRTSSRSTASARCSSRRRYASPCRRCRPRTSSA